MLLHLLLRLSLSVMFAMFSCPPEATATSFSLPSIGMLRKLHASCTRWPPTF